jgi:hypothetical protein
MIKQFTRTIEDFNCENCSAAVKGTGYTNHCPSCLWSKHVDINPGDRREKCGGMMRPVSVEKKSEGYIVLQKCERCNFERKNKIGKEDSFETAIAISKMGI